MVLNAIIPSYLAMGISKIFFWSFISSHRNLVSANNICLTLYFNFSIDEGHFKSNYSYNLYE